MKTKEERRAYMRKYVNERRANDSEFRKRSNKHSANYTKARYARDPEFRQYIKDKAKQRMQRIRQEVQTMREAKRG